MTYQQIVPTQTLQKSDKILFLIHLAIGDFTYMQNIFRTIKQRHPHLQLDIFVLENRCTTDSSKWPLLKNYVIYDWLESCGLFRKVYRENYAPHLIKKSILEAQQENYPIAVVLSSMPEFQTEILAREIVGKHGLLIGQKSRFKWHRPIRSIIKRRASRDLDLYYKTKKLKPGEHISAAYNSWCEQLIGVTLSPEERLPYIDIPPLWQKRVADKIKSLQNNTVKNSPVLFINYLAKDPKRSWRIEQALMLVQLLQQKDSLKNSLFILNTIPEKQKNLDQAIYNRNLNSTFSFSATDNFYQLPAMLQLSDLIISVETSIIHLANAVKKPVIALMRQRTPQWVPLDKKLSTVIWVPNKKDHVTAISPSTVTAVLENYLSSKKRS
ncbi:MAG TPA: glycosyltransferase family 9 protein [Tissierellaceae bacterium]